MIRHINTVRRSERIGSKARSLNRLAKYKFRIPETMVLTEESRTRYNRDPEVFESLLRKRLQGIIDPHQTYAVRSSSELEDQSDHSFAGQFQSLLNISGVDGILEAIKDVWGSAEGIEESEYFKKLSGGKNNRGMGVIIQEMVKAKWTGVAFSINPITGRDEIIIEAVEGQGESMLQKGKNPCRWTYSQGSWDEFEKGASLDIRQLDKLVSAVRKLRDKCRSEIDLEWAFDGEDLYYLQCRSVTASKYPVVYSNHISREVLPGMIKPLVWSVNIPLVNSAWIRLLERLMGPLGMAPEQLSKSFYYRAYFNMGTLGTLFRMMGMPRNSLESLMGRKDPSGKSAFRPSLKAFRYLPRMTWFLLSNINLGRRFRRKISSLEQECTELSKELKKDFSPDRYPGLFRRVMAMSREAAYFNIIMPLAMQIRDRLLKRRMEKRKLSYADLDFTQDFPVLRNYDPQYLIKRNHALWKKIPDAYRKKVKSYDTLQEPGGPDEVTDFQRAFEELLARFGHFSESGNDFSYPSWKEDPDFLLNVVRQGQEGTAATAKGHARKSSKPGRQKSGRAYYRAGKYRLYREMISSEYTRGYGLFRKLFLKTGACLAGSGRIQHPDDVFYLTLEEHDRLLQEQDNTQIRSLGQEISRRKQEMSDFEDISLPSIIYGEDPPPLARPDEKVFQGIPVSPGIYEGEVVVVRGYKDFHKKVEGAILVIPFSDVGWTPILTRAGAIVSESGGMLSHASIVARELAIPAIASVDHACSLEDGIRARLDGYNGLLLTEQ
jgi:pyruvate,water dikinase